MRQHASCQHNKHVCYSSLARNPMFLTKVTHLRSKKLDFHESVVTRSLQLKSVLSFTDVNPLTTAMKKEGFLDRSSLAIASPMNNVLARST